ncbi:CaiB/BaiF CoA transferase family protein [Antarctobacter heliothermus]|uniref:Crotonobetainyl-CoA:carnitine CoA-transferase CaiB n=1 Tax=Antarctobacter heliothermus TaxID=74033 RepID=A0A239DKI3_9RHOB|nr:CaiB/BaiF CoA-transferase family protein [Antarctobacter heliothermus]SNS32970.1 Crotonobetainyl-CoA:carnitine CoA-transferase CaiB [Antarctobacter heliothermus]
MLTGIRIVEFEALGPAPFAAMHLADLGAEVIVVQRRGGAENPAKGASGLLDRGKRAIALDLKDTGDLGIARALIRSADGLIEGMRPGVMERLGLGPQQVRDAHPALVYGRMTGWGQEGPRAWQAGHDLNYLGLSGALFYGGLPGAVPGVPPTMLGDIGAGALYLTVGMLAGLVQARTSGVGCVVDAAIVDGAQHMMALLRSLGSAFDTGARGRSLLDGPHWSRCYACACGGHVAVQCLEPKFYALFLDKMGLANDPDFAVQFDPDQWAAQGVKLGRIFAENSCAHWVGIFDGTDACVAPVLSPDAAAQDAHMAARGHGAGSALPAPRFDGAVLPVGTPPRHGQDGDAILAELVEKGLL